MNKKIKIMGSVILSAVLAQSMLPLPIYALEDENPTQKTETVYAVLNADGSISDTIVSSWLHDDDGIHNIKETLDETDVENVKTDEEPKVDGNVYTWNSKHNDIYYQGKTTKQLPIEVKITYELDGHQLSAKEVAGQSGHLKLTIHFENLESKTVYADGKAITVHPSFLAGGLLTLNADHYENVSCSNGKIVNDGTNEVLAFANVPGLAGTLQEAGLNKIIDQLHISDDTVIETDVKDFDLGSIMIAMTNEISLDELAGQLSIGDLTGGINQLVSASDQLLDGSKQLYEGTTELKEGAKPLTSATPQIQQLADASTQLHTGSSLLLDGIKAYTQGVTQLDKGNQKLTAIPAAMQQTVQGSTSLSQGSQKLQEGLAQLEEQVNGLDKNTLSKLTQAMNATKQELTTLQTQLSTSKEALASLENSLQTVHQAMTGLDTFQTQFEALVASVNQTVENDQSKIQSFNAQLESAKEAQLQALQSSIQALQTSKSAIPQEDTTGAASKIDEQITGLQSQLQVVQSIDVQGYTLETLDVQKAQLQTLLSQTKQSLEGLSKVMEGTKSDMQKLQTSMQTAAQSMATLEQIMTGVHQNMSDQDFVQLITKLQGGVSQLKAGADQLHTGSVALESGLQQLQSEAKTAVDQLNAGSQQIVSKNEELISGASLLDEGTAQLEGQKSKLMEMSDGLVQLQNAFDTLENGAKQLYDGQSQFNEQGMNKLKETADLTTSEFNTLQTVFDQIDALNKEHKSFAGTPDNSENIVRFVFRTKDIESKDE